MKDALENGGKLEVLLEKEKVSVISAVSLVRRHGCPPMPKKDLNRDAKIVECTSIHYTYGKIHTRTTTRKRKLSVIMGNPISLNFVKPAKRECAFSE